MANILIVEDDKDIAKLLCLQLQSYGHEPTAFHTPAKAIEAVTDGYIPDVACLDINLPGMDGFYLWYRLRRHPRLSERMLPTIFISAFDDPEHVVESRALGAAYVTKPFAPETLQRAVMVATSSLVGR